MVPLWILPEIPWQDICLSYLAYCYISSCFLGTEVPGFWYWYNFIHSGEPVFWDDIFIISILKTWRNLVFSTTDYIQLKTAKILWEEYAANIPSSATVLVFYHFVVQT
jgi:hypothetical protein